MTKDVRVKAITIRMTWKQNESVKKSAIEQDLNMSDYIRQFVPELKGGNK
jgi:predicted DNA binding CopG/RHH family protein